MLAISQAMGTDSAGEATAEERAASTATGTAPAASLPWPDVKPLGHSRYNLVKHIENHKRRFALRQPENERLVSAKGSSGDNALRASVCRGAMAAQPERRPLDVWLLSTLHLAPVLNRCLSTLTGLRDHMQPKEVPNVRMAQRRPQDLVFSVA